MSNKLSVKERLLAFLSKTSGYNTFSVAQAQVTARIAELRQDGHAIYTNTKRRSDGSKVSVYRLGAPTRAMRAANRKRRSA